MGSTGIFTCCHRLRLSALLRLTHPLCANIARHPWFLGIGSSQCLVAKRHFRFACPLPLTRVLHSKVARSPIESLYIPQLWHMHAPFIFGGKSADQWSSYSPLFQGCRFKATLLAVSGPYLLYYEHGSFRGLSCVLWLMSRVCLDLLPLSRPATEIVLCPRCPITLLCLVAKPDFGYSRSNCSWTLWEILYEGVTLDTFYMNPRSGDITQGLPKVHRILDVATRTHRARFGRSDLLPSRLIGITPTELHDTQSFMIGRSFSRNRSGFSKTQLSWEYSCEYMILRCDNVHLVRQRLYDSWKSRMGLYMQNREHGRMILESVENGPLSWLVEENGVIITKKYAELFAAEKIQADQLLKFMGREFSYDAKVTGHMVGLPQLKRPGLQHYIRRKPMLPEAQKLGPQLLDEAQLALLVIQNSAGQAQTIILDMCFRTAYLDTYYF
ncbi:hypothetical protein Tco_0168986 [Tanacetum coccineum]|uniref:Phospholipid scramblase n=1 Tax=Tanacetum coccineum TaxID=301880 RepID=A0ABQ5BCD1_9ASTR